ncbi:adenosylcobinamide-GDP ribazoletransferase [Aeribacillus pallidus]|uniref:adenosylcobinamide-GDP ribazoletransferase n=1 Tax=Aeribacillus pallidus TaxID=33936 RepID=UPI003D243174
MKKALQDAKNGFLLALQFFSAIPIHRSIPIQSITKKRMIQSFPLIGLFIGLILWGLLYLLSVWSPFSILAVTFIVFLTSILLTGGIHVDGWIDCSDAYFSYRDREKRLDIMKDPRVGAFGVLSVILLLSAKFFVMYETIARIDVKLLFIMISIPFLSRIGAGYLLVMGKPAREEGMAVFFKNGVGKQNLIVYPMYVFVFSIIIYSFVKEAFFIYWWLVFTFILWLIFTYRFIMKHFGGITGDIIGASIEGGEVMLWIVLWLCSYYVMA